MSSIFISGCSSYIGKNLARRLLNDNFDVTGFARTFMPKELKNINWITGDILNYNQVSEAVKNCDTIFHLASTDLGNSFINHREDLLVNVVGTKNILESAVKNNVRKIIFTSSAQVYGRKYNLPQKECAITEPLSPYALHKLYAEQLCQYYSRMHSLNILVLRLFNVYGIGYLPAFNNTVDITFIKKITKNIRPKLKSHYLESRDFIHIKDVVNALVLAMLKDNCSDVINIGSGIETPIKKLIEIIISNFDKEIVAIEQPSEDLPNRYQADTKKAETVLGFKHKIPLEKGTHDLINFIIKNNSILNKL